MSTIVFKVEEAERKVSKNDKPYVRARAAGLGWMSAWGADDGNLLLATSLPATFKGELVEKDGFKNLSGLTLADGATPTTQPDKMSKEEWREKDKMDWLRRLYISHLGNLTQVCEPGVGWDFYEKQVMRKARMYATADLLWIEGGGIEVPFS